MSRADLERWANEAAQFGSDSPMFIAGFEKALAVLETDVNIRLSQLMYKLIDARRANSLTMEPYISGARNELCLFVEDWIKGFKE